MAIPLVSQSVSQLRLTVSFLWAAGCIALARETSLFLRQGGVTRMGRDPVGARSRRPFQAAAIAPGRGRFQAARRNS